MEISRVRELTDQLDLLLDGSAEFNSVVIATYLEVRKNVSKQVRGDVQPDKR